MKKGCVTIYITWFVGSLIYAVLMRNFSNAFFWYFVANMVAFGSLNIIIIHYILKNVRLIDKENYEYIRHVLLTRSCSKELTSEYSEIQKLFDEYNSLSIYSLFDVFVVIVVGFICPP